MCGVVNKQESGRGNLPGVPPLVVMVARGAGEYDLDVGITASD